MLTAFCRPPATERFTSMLAFERLLAQKRAEDRIEPVLAPREMWLSVEGVLMHRFFAFHARHDHKLRPDTIVHILEFVGDGLDDGGESGSTFAAESIADSLSSATSIEFARRRLYQFLHV
ncbi:unnamed protein product [Symbiodinium natans]|uniref:Uncharacterized protein n=1 Tax=Symbiodinium natans TaxID=878477 RepID=A0A812IN09_9DINO|nr:unnamed protein product [Symbiodinium natans]